jgi:hypothetical protein
MRRGDRGGYLGPSRRASTAWNRQDQPLLAWGKKRSTRAEKPFMIPTSSKREREYYQHSNDGNDVTADDHELLL